MEVAAELDVCHCRPIAPTRRVAVGSLYLPAEPPPGPGGLLLGGIVAAFARELDDDTLEGYVALLGDLDRGARIVQPRLRYRFQSDTHGLVRSRHRMIRTRNGLELHVQGRSNPLAQLLGAAYVAGRFSARVRPVVTGTLLRALDWHGGTGPDLIHYLQGGAPRHPVLDVNPEWARRVLGFGQDDVVARPDVQKRFRLLLWAAHPDHGGDSDGAAERIHQLHEARRILLEAV